MTTPIDPFYFRVARIALSVAAAHGFALGGGLALAARGMLDRPTQDVDLFSDRDSSIRLAADVVRVDVLDIGPVLHIDDLRAWKVAALVARAEPRDFIDVAAFLADHTPDELLAGARRVDPGMEESDITAVGVRLARMPDWELTNYGLDDDAAALVRQRFAAWPGTGSSARSFAG